MTSMWRLGTALLTLIALAITLLLLLNGPSAVDPAPGPLGRATELSASAGPVQAPPHTTNQAPVANDRVAVEVDGDLERDLVYERALGSLTGRVVEEDGTPVAGVSVTLFGGHLTQLRLAQDSFFSREGASLELLAGGAITNADGRFRADRVDPALMLVAGIDLGGPRGTVRLLEQSVDTGRCADVGDLVLAPYATFAGRVTDGDGNPLGGARVRATEVPKEAIDFGLADLGPGGGILLDAGEKAGGLLVWRLPPFAARLLQDLPVPTTRTGRDGRYELPGIPSGLITVVVDCAGFVTRTLGPIPSGDLGGRRDIGTIELSTGETLAGRFVREDGTPIAEAEVFVGRRTEVEKTTRVTVLRPGEQTDAEGRFRVEALTDDEHYLALRERGEVAWTVVEATPGYDEPVVHATHSYDATLTALDAEGGPIRDPELALAEMAEISGVIPLLLPPHRIEGEPLEDGRVRIRHLGRGNHGLLVRAPGHAVGQAEFSIADGPVELTVRLQKGWSAEVEVTGEDGEPVPRARVAASTHDGFLRSLEPPALTSVLTDAAGVAVLEDLPAEAEILLEVQHPRYAICHALLKKPQDEPLPVRLTRGGVVTGRIHLQGEPLETRMVAILTRRQKEMQLPRFALPDATGQFSFRSVGPGFYKLEVQERGQPPFELPKLLAVSRAPMDRGRLREEEFLLRRDEEKFVDMDLLGARGEGPAARVQGRVFLNGVPAAGAVVTLETKGDLLGRQNGQKRQITTDESGQFDAGSLAVGVDGKLVVTVVPRELLGERGARSFYYETFTVAAGGRNDLTIQVLTGSLLGRIVDAADGRPLEAGISVCPVNGTRNDQRLTRADERGRFQIGPLAEGEYALSAWKGYDDYHKLYLKPLAVRAGVPSPPLLLELERTILVSGEVRTDLTGVTEIRVRFKNDGFNETFYCTLEEGKASFKSREIRAGTYEVRVSIYRGKERSRFTTTVVVPESGIQDLILSG